MSQFRNIGRLGGHSFLRFGLVHLEFGISDHERHPRRHTHIQISSTSAVPRVDRIVHSSF